MRTSIMMTLALLLAAAPLSAQAQRQARRGLADRYAQTQQQQRLQLERQVIQQFVRRAGTEVGLDDPGRRRLLQILETSQTRRRELVRQTTQLRRELNQAIASPDTPDSEFQRLLDRMNDLREQDNRLWQQEREQIAATLSPRQQAIVLVRLANLQQRIQELIDGRPPGGGPPREGRTTSRHGP